MDILVSILLSIYMALSAFIADSTVVKPESEFATSTALVVQVVDGDTIKVIQDQKEFTVRYIGIDTPERYVDGQPACYSQQATDANAELVAGKIVTLVPDSEPTDKYDRQLRYVYVDGLFVNEELVARGYAKTLSIPPNRRFAEHFTSVQNSAKQQQIGLWSSCKQ